MTHSVDRAPASARKRGLRLGPGLIAHEGGRKYPCCRSRSTEPTTSLDARGLLSTWDARSDPRKLRCGCLAAESIGAARSCSLIRQTHGRRTAVRPSVATHPRQPFAAARPRIVTRSIACKVHSRADGVGAPCIAGSDLRRRGRQRAARDAPDRACGSEGPRALRDEYERDAPHPRCGDPKAPRRAAPELPSRDDSRPRPDDSERSNASDHAGNVTSRDDSPRPRPRGRLARRLRARLRERNLAPTAGLEPATRRLTAACSTN